MDQTQRLCVQQASSLSTTILSLRDLAPSTSKKPLGHRELHKPTVRLTLFTRNVKYCLPQYGSLFARELTTTSFQTHISLTFALIPIQF
jgi:hypothetical protein